MRTPKTLSQWLELGEGLARGQSTSLESPDVPTRSITRADCFAAAVRLEPQSARAWCLLGGELELDEQFPLHAAGCGAVGPVECYAKAVQVRPGDATGWTNLGVVMRPGQTVLIDGKQLGRREVFLAGAGLDAAAAEAWFGLADCLREGPGGTAVLTIDGAERGPAECYARALTVDPEHGRAWAGLAGALGDSVTLDGRRQIFVSDALGVVIVRRACIEALRRRTDEPQPWLQLGLDMVAGGEASCTLAEVAGRADGGPVTVTPRFCFVEALTLDQKLGPAWRALATQLATGEAAAVQGKEYDIKACALQALRSCPKDGATWAQLGAVMAAGEKLPFGSHQIDRALCFSAAFKHSPRSPDVWILLASTLDAEGDDSDAPAKTAVALGRTVVLRDCLVEALGIDPHHFADAWLRLGREMSAGDFAILGPRNVGRIDCFVGALEAVPPAPAAWLDLGLSLRDAETTTVNGKSVSGREALAEAAATGATVAWLRLASALQAATRAMPLGGQPATASVLGEAMTAVDCYMHVVTTDSCYPEAWRALSEFLADDGGSVEIDGQAMTAVSCAVAAIEHDFAGNTNAQSWLTLGLVAPEMGTVRVGKERLTRTNILSRAVELNTKAVDGWMALGATLGDAQSAAVDGKPYTAVSCFIEAVNMAADRPDAWMALGASLRADQLVAIRGRRRGRRDCFAEALALEPNATDAWGAIAAEMDDGDSANINGKFVSRSECIHQAQVRANSMVKTRSAAGLLQARLMSFNVPMVKEETTSNHRA